jgi:lipopolysaccharide assembly outer membrane protein LptD (OstA)
VSIAKQLLEELETNEEVRKLFLSKMVVRIAEEPTLRLTLLQSLLTEVATKHDLEVTKYDLNKGIDDVNKRIDDVNKRIDDLRSEMNSKFDAVNKRIDDLRKDMRAYFFGFMGGILATILTVVITRLI